MARVVRLQSNGLAVVRARVTPQAHSPIQLRTLQPILSCVGCALNGWRMNGRKAAVSESAIAGKWSWRAEPQGSADVSMIFSLTHRGGKDELSLDLMTDKRWCCSSRVIEANRSAAARALVLASSQRAAAAAPLLRTTIAAARLNCSQMGKRLEDKGASRDGWRNSSNGGGGGGSGNAVAAGERRVGGPVWRSAWAGCCHLLFDCARRSGCMHAVNVCLLRVEAAS